MGFLGVAGCSSQPATVSCVANLNENCSPLISPPTFTAIFDQILQPRCALGMGTCHTADAAMGGLVFADADTAYALLLGTQGGRARVLPGNPACSLIVEKLESPNASFRMPPGNMPLDEPSRCAIEQWIAQGAAR